MSIRKPIVSIAAILLAPILFSFGFLISFSQVLSTPDALKDALRQSNVYESAITSLVRQPEGEMARGTGGVSSSQEAVQDAIGNALPAETLEKHSGEIIDGVYAWLQGSVAAPSFQIDIVEIRDTLATNLSEEARAKAAQLPACPPETTASPEEFDPFGATCLPAGANPGAIAEKTRQEILTSELFSDPVLDANDLKTKDGRSLQDQLKPLSDGYTAMHNFTVITGIAALILAAIILFVSAPLHIGMRRLGILLLSVGVTSAVLALLGGLILNGVIDAITRSAGEASIQAAGAQVVQHLSASIRAWWLSFGIGLATLGICLLFGQAILKKRKQGSAASKTSVTNKPLPKK